MLHEEILKWNKNDVNQLLSYDLDSNQNNQQK